MVVKPSMSENSTVAVSCCGRGRLPAMKVARSRQISSATGWETWLANSCIMTRRSARSRNDNCTVMAAMPATQPSHGAISGTSGPPAANSAAAPAQPAAGTSRPTDARLHNGSPASATATPAAAISSASAASPATGRRGLLRPSSSWASTCASISTPAVEEPAGDSGVRCWSIPASAVPTSTVRPASQSLGSRATASAG